MKPSVDEIRNTIKEYIKEQKFHFSNEQSWFQCYSAFGKADSKSNADSREHLALLLTAYLASWGMYRSSSKLSKTNYTVHLKAVDIILEFKENLYSLPQTMPNVKSISEIMELKDRLHEHYSSPVDTKVESGTTVEKIHISPTDTLLSKIILGTLGCVPAYDYYVLKGIVVCSAPKVFEKKSLGKIFQFAEEHKFKLISESYTALNYKRSIFKT